MDEDRNKREATFFFQFAFKLSNSEPGTKKTKKNLSFHGAMAVQMYLGLEVVCTW